MIKNLLVLNCAILVFGITRIEAQSLYTETGSNSTPAQVKPNNCNSNNYSYSVINVNNALVEKGLYSSYGIEKNMRLHTQCNSQLESVDFAKNKRWYQEDGKTQVFRIFKGEDEPSGYSRARTEAHSIIQWGKGEWHEWVGRFTMIKNANCSIFQIKSNGKEGYEWPMQLDYGNGTLHAQLRIPEYTNGQLSGGKTVQLVNIGNYGLGIGFDIKVRDNGETIIVFVNGVEKVNFSHPRPAGSEQRFRWGMYIGKADAIADGMMFVSHAQIDPPPVDNQSVNKAPTISFNALDKDLLIPEGYTSLEVSASANDIDGDIDKVELKIDGQLVREESTPPFVWGGGKQSQELLGLSVGVHTFTVTAYDNKGAMATVQRKVTVDKLTSLNDSESIYGLSVFPNPSIDGKFQLSKVANWKVYNLLGTELKVGNSDQIDLSEEPKGVFLIKINERMQRVVVE